MTRQEKALDIAEYAIGVPLFVAVAASTAAVMAIGFPVMEAVNWARNRS